MIGVLQSLWQTGFAVCDPSSLEKIKAGMTALVMTSPLTITLITGVFDQPVNMRDQLKTLAQCLEKPDSARLWDSLMQNAVSGGYKMQLPYLIRLNDLRLSKGNKYPTGEYTGWLCLTLTNAIADAVEIKAKDPRLPMKVEFYMDGLRFIRPVESVEERSIWNNIRTHLSSILN